MRDSFSHRTDLQAARERQRRYDPVAHESARRALQERANRVRERIDIKDVVEAVVGRMKKAGRAFVACCPFHADHTASFAVYPKGGNRVEAPFFVCYGCQLKGDVIKFVMERQKLDWREAIELLESQNGLGHLEKAAPPPPRPAAAQVGDYSKRDRARALWEGSQALAADGPVDRYLRGRSIVPPASYGVGDASVNAGWPVDLRFVARCWHDLEKAHFPAMVAAIRAHDGTLLTVHRTYLTERKDGSWGKAPVEKAKLVVGTYEIGFIRLGPDADDMGGGEGIETSLSAMQLYKRSGICFVTAGRMKSVEPPFFCSTFLYWADKGCKAGRQPWGEIFAHDGARAAFNKGRKVAVQIPNIDLPKADFNDLIQAQARGDWVPAPPKVTAAPIAAPADKQAPPPSGPLVLATAMHSAWRHCEAMQLAVDAVEKAIRDGVLTGAEAEESLAMAKDRLRAAGETWQAAYDAHHAAWKNRRRVA